MAPMFVVHVVRKECDSRARVSPRRCYSAKGAGHQETLVPSDVFDLFESTRPGSSSTYPWYLGPKTTCNESSGPPK